MCLSVCVFLCACVLMYIAHVCIYICVCRRLSVSLCERGLAHRCACHINVRVCVCVRVCWGHELLVQSLPFAPRPPKSCWGSAETEWGWRNMPCFHFQTPLGPPKEKNERRETKRRKKKGLTVLIGSQRQAFLHQGKNQGKSPKTGTFFLGWREGGHLPCPLLASLLIELL